MKRFLIIVGVLALFAWLRTCFIAVDVAEFAYVARFGDPVRLYDGAAESGLQVKAPWPVDSVVRIDRRLQTFDLPTIESLTLDPTTKTVDKTLAVDAYVTWKIDDAVGADRFLKTLGTPEQLRRVLGPTISGRLGSLISRLPLTDLIAVVERPDQLDGRSDKLHAQLLGDGADNLREKFRTEYGIDLVEIRLRRLSYPEAVRNGIAERIRSERLRKVADYESEGRQRAAEILSKAEKDAKETEAKARADKQRLDGLADVKADAIRNAAHAQDREFYAFLQKLKAYQSLLADTRDVLLLSTKHPLFDLLLSPPKASPPK